MVSPTIRAHLRCGLSDRYLSSIMEYRTLLCTGFKPSLTSGKCTGSNNTHGIIDIRGFHGFLQIHFMNFVKNISFPSFHFLLYFCSPNPLCYMSRFLTYFAFSSINSLLGSTFITHQSGKGYIRFRFFFIHDYLF